MTEDGGTFGHGSETFFIEGEGLLGETGGGRQVTRAATEPFRFSRLGPRGKPLSEQNMRRISRAMIDDGGGNTGIPAGYTYLGQFIDHDLTFDKTVVTLGEDVSPSAMLQGRSPALDLDSLYGAGPEDEVSAGFYADDRHLLTGVTVKAGSDIARVGYDLPRIGKGRRRKVKIRANIPDLRNDENLAVAQTTAAMVRFHNRVVDRLPASVPQTQRFRRARRQVVKHYQWVIRHDYLPRICEPSVVDDVFANGRKVVEPGADPLSMPRMPVEFSVAAFRLGHSMVRDAYSWNVNFPGTAGTLGFLFDFSGTSGTLGGNLRLPSNWIADFRRLYDFPADAGRADLAAPSGQPNHAKRIDTLLVDPLENLPTGAFGGPAVPFGDPRGNLAFRNLDRASMVKLATGQQMVTLLKGAGVKVRALTKNQLLTGKGGAVLSGLSAVERESLATRTPLWFYILREAELNDGRLTGVGARIVAETLHRAMEGSMFSIVRDSNWTPFLGPDKATFRMVDLLLFAFEGKRKLLNPLGD